MCYCTHSRIHIYNVHKFKYTLQTLPPVIHEFQLLMKRPSPRHLPKEAAFNSSGLDCKAAISCGVTQDCEAKQAEHHYF